MRYALPMRCALPMLLALAALCSTDLQAQAGSDDFSGSSLEELTQVKVKVTSASRKEEDLDETPAAVYVLTREDIEHSHAANIPDLLRTVPGLQVAQVTASTWAISARGFNSAFANKLLVLIDGRTVYSEIYDGAHWDEIDLPLQDVERIEIIRGPGAAVWGANAVNGVINILTLPARSAQGTRTDGSFSRMQGTTFAEHGGVLGDIAQYRVFGSFIKRRALVEDDGSPAFDGQEAVRVGGRVDWQRGSRDHFILTGDGYRSNFRQKIIPGVSLPLPPGGLEHDNSFGGFLSGVWKHDAAKSNSMLQTYASTTTRDEVTLTARTRTLDMDFVDHRRASSRVDLVWGAEARYTQDYTDGPVRVTVQPTFNNYLVDGFLQADFSLKPHKLVGSLASKVQSSSLTGFQLQPSTRLMWLISAKHSLWGAISRAVVTPSIQDTSLSFPVQLGSYNGLPIVTRVSGNPLFKPEEVLSGEAGYRWRPDRHLSVDVALFRNSNRRLQTFTIVLPTFQPLPTPRLEADWKYANDYSGTSEGAELSVNWRPGAELQFAGAYTWIEGRFKQNSPGNVVLVDTFATPRNAVSGTAFWSFAKDWEFSGVVQGVSRRPAQAMPSELLAFQTNPNAQNEVVPGYVRLDAHVSRHLWHRGLLEVGGTNLLQSRHAEFASTSTFIAAHKIPRSLLAQASWSF